MLDVVYRSFILARIVVLVKSNGFVSRKSHEVGLRIDWSTVFSRRISNATTKTVSIMKCTRDGESLVSF